VIVPLVVEISVSIIQSLGRLRGLQLNTLKNRKYHSPRESRRTMLGRCAAVSIAYSEPGTEEEDLPRPEQRHEGGRVIGSG
jgi:hypothetical protein